MTTATVDKPKRTWFRSDPAKGIAEGETRVDREKGIIYGYSVATVGEAKGHGMMLDAKTLEQIVELGNKAKLGVKSRFTHPGLSSDGMGKFLGRSKNFRLDGDRARADLHLSKVADSSPDGSLGSYVLDLAEEDPDAFGSSIVFDGKREYVLNEDGTRKTDKEGNPLKPLVRVSKLHASDIVDEPAANDGLFSAESIDFDNLPDAEARQATAILDKLFGDATPAETQLRVENFLKRYYANKGVDMSTATETKTGEPAPANKPADPTPAPVTFTAEQLAEKEKAAAEAARNEALAAERKRVDDIHSLCELARCPQLAKEFVAKGLSRDEVQTKLREKIGSENPPVGDGGGSAGDPKPADEDAKYKAEYAADAKRLKAIGISEADYVFSRRVDDGLEELRPNSYPKLAS